jgi:hypothetical protein
MILLNSNFAFYMPWTDCAVNYDVLDFSLMLQGYDIFSANAFSESVDPGFMNGRIFLGECTDGGTRYRDFLTITSNLRCSAQYSVNSYRNTYDFTRASTGQFSVTNEVDRQLGAAVYGFSNGAQTKQASSRDEEFSDIYQRLAESRGEVMVVSAHCFTHDVAMTKFARQR